MREFNIKGTKLCFAGNNRNTKLCTGFRRNKSSEGGRGEGAGRRRDDIELVKNSHGSKRRWVGDECRWLGDCEVSEVYVR